LVGKTLSAVTLEQHGMALTTNFVKVRMARPRDPNRLVNLEIGSLSEVGLKEQTPLSVLD
jgi:hypothetical protein